MLQSNVRKLTLLHRHISHENQCPMTLGEHHPKAARKQRMGLSAGKCCPLLVKWLLHNLTQQPITAKLKQVGYTGTERIGWLYWDIG